MSREYCLDTKLRVVFFSTENRLALVNLAAKYWLKFNNEVNLSGISIIVNRIPQGIALPNNGIEYINAGVNYCPGSTHFGPSLKAALNQIKEDYVFFYCDDYITTHTYNVAQLDNLVRMMIYDNVDFVSFASMYPERFKFKPYPNTEQYGFERGTFFEIDQTYRHAYSVQPCIWNRHSLLKLLSTNPHLTLHALDNSSIADKAGNYRELNYETNVYPNWNKETSYNFKTLCTKYKIFDLGYPHDFFVLGYREIMRHGMFHIERNDFNDMLQYDNNSFIENFIKTENLENDPAFAAFLPAKRSASH